MVFQDVTTELQHNATGVLQLVSYPDGEVFIYTNDFSLNRYEISASVQLTTADTQSRTNTAK